ncbi:MAG: glycosyltransferase [Janthinobacterium lividum]
MHDVANAAVEPLRLSIAMCTFNAGRYLEEQLATISVQTRLPDELVVCDDGSSDATMSQLYAFARVAPYPVRIIQNAQTLGYSRNFAQAIELCTGEAIILSDQDDRWHTTRLEKMKNIFLQDENAMGVFTNGDLMDEQSCPLPGTLWSSFGFGFEDQERMQNGEAVQVLVQRNVVTGMALAIRGSARKYLRSMPQHWPHDSWLALMLASKGQLRACPEELVTYRVHAKQQIGVPLTGREKLSFLQTHGLRAYLRSSRERNIREYTREAIQYEALLQAAESNDDLKHAWWFSMARAKTEHARRGVRHLQLSTIDRIRQVLKYRKEYRHYSPTGSAAFWRDLLL